MARNRQLPAFEQLLLPTLGPEPGSVWRNVHTREIAVVLRVDTRRHQFVTVRKSGRETSVALVHFPKVYEPHRIINNQEAQ